ncbi:protein YgfX [Aestuariibacter salexigens]|uniref:protein YgfX n=1 Tax=Aestuariibacter salexigens TaxID=226010 RepID=UPI003B8360C5
MPSYDVRIAPSAIGAYCSAALFGAAALAVSQWQSYIIPHQTLWQGTLMLLLVGQGLHCISKGHASVSQPQQFIFDECGRGWRHSNAFPQQVNIHKDSRACGPIIWLHLQNVSSGRVNAQLVFNTQCHERDFRRLCRILLSVTSGQNTR